MKVIYLFVIIVILVSCKRDFFESINEKLEPSYPNRGKIIESSHTVRKKIYKSGYLSFITEKDIVFLIDDYDLPSATHYGSIWTKNKFFHYSYSNNSLKELSYPPIRYNILSLVTKWDTTAIRQESNTNYNQLNKDHLITAYKTYKQNTKITVEKISFRPFY